MAKRRTPKKKSGPKNKKKETMNQTKKFIEEYRKKEAKCRSCKVRKNAHKKLMKTRGKRSTVEAIRYYWKKYLECESCVKKA